MTFFDYFLTFSLLKFVSKLRNVWIWGFLNLEARVHIPNAFQPTRPCLNSGTSNCSCDTIILNFASCPNFSLFIQKSLAVSFSALRAPSKLKFYVQLHPRLTKELAFQAFWPSDHFRRFQQKNNCVIAK